MIKKIILFLYLITCVSGAYLEDNKWRNGESFLSFLENNQIPLSLYYNLDREDRELAEEIRTDTIFQVLRNDNGQAEQFLIPVGEELQLHLYRDSKTNEFALDIIPVQYKMESLGAVVEIEKTPYQDIVSNTNNPLLANEFLNAYKKTVNFKHVKKGDKLVLFYSQRKRMGKRYGSPQVEAAMVEIGGKKHFVFLYDGNYYDEKGRELEGYMLKMPISNYKRVSSPFTHKRWHPILKRYKAHLGIDYAASRGAYVKSAGDGVVSFVGRKGGYGKIVEIRHRSGYKTIYAHLNGFKKGLHKGQRVKKGQHIAYVGNTGRSTGPHLHFGLYKNNRALNPNRVVKVAKNIVSGSKRIKFDRMVRNYKNKFEIALIENKVASKEQKFDYLVSMKNKAQYSSN